MLSLARANRRKRLAFKTRAKVAAIVAENRRVLRLKLACASRGHKSKKNTRKYCYLCAVVIPAC